MPHSPRRPVVVLAGALTLGAGLLTAVSSSATADVPGPPEVVDLQLLSFNDYHGHLEPPTGRDATLGKTLDPAGTPVGGSAYLAAHLRGLREGQEHSLTVAAGDLIGGSPFLSGLFHDEPAVETLNTDGIGLDVSSVGNHEFDEGLTELRRMQNGGCHPDDGCFDSDGYGGADFPWLAANVVDSATGETVLPGTEVRDVGGVKVGFIGMTLENTPELVAASGIRGLEFRDEVETANAAAQDLVKQGVKSIVVLLHEGGFQAGTYQECVGASGPVVDIAENLSPEIDMVVTGHTHQPYVCDIPDPEGESRLVTSASSYGRVITETTLALNTVSGDVIREKSRARNHLVTRDVAPDAETTDIIAKWKELAGPVANRWVGDITADIPRGAGGSRSVESPLGNLIADAQLAATHAPEDGGADLALMNPGGIRADLTYKSSPEGEGDGVVTYGEAFTVQPFGNLLQTITLTGEEIELALEQQWTTQADGSTRLLLLSTSEGFTYSYDPAAPNGDHVDPADIYLNGVPLDPAAEYRVTVNSFLADGGDGFKAFVGGRDKTGGGVDLDAFTTYLGRQSPVSPPATGRVTVLP